MKKTSKFHQRRQLLRGGLALGALGALGKGSLLLSLGQMSQAVAGTGGDYKAIVCLFLDGGNDSFSTLVPIDSTSRALYEAARGAVGVGTSGLYPLVPDNAQPGGRQVALHPELAGLGPVFDAGRLAVVAAVGTLIEPVTLATLEAGQSTLPRDLFSHEQQAFQWQTVVNNGQLRGWGARLADYVVNQNQFAPATAISTFGQSPWLNGNLVSQFVVGGNGDVGSIASAGSRLDRATGQAHTRSNLLEQAYAASHDRLRDGASAISSAILPVSALPPVPNELNSLAVQLRTVARMIGGRASLGAGRQVFCCSVTGYDTHVDQLNLHNGLMRDLGQAMVYFDQALDHLGVSDKVTTFTASDFGRNLVANDGGTDHGWGSQQLVMGGAVNGRNIIGELPDLDAVNGSDIWRQNYIVPKIASDQLGGSLGRWFGLSDSQLAEVFPNVANNGFDSMVIPGSLPLFAGA
ncbi:MAG: DUF1501 domain-containing protein [Wenzhouxiangellaceae bacterium]|nr:MAG: DUF1501 domain-containing protein [Wenzhouxiangellaceae bacterium]